MLMNYTLRFVLLLLFIVYFISARSVPGLSLLEISVNLLQYRGSVGILNNRSFFVIIM